MAYTDVEGKTILEAWGKFKGLLYADCDVGDLLSRDTTNDGWILADQSTSIVAEAVAMQNGVAGAEIWMCLAAVIEAPPTESAGDWSAGVLALTGDKCSLLYVGESGKAQSSAGGTLAQTVGIILTTSTAILKPNVYLTGTDMTLSGNASVGGTLGVTGAVTLASTLAVAEVATLTKGATVGSGYNITFTKGGVLEYVGAVGADTTATSPGTYIAAVSAADAKLTLPSAVAGLEVTVIVDSATKQCTIVPGSGDKLLTVDYTAKDSVINTKGAGAWITYRALTTTNWMRYASYGTWTES
jgi:hypothetical protein